MLTVMHSPGFTPNKTSAINYMALLNILKG